MGIENGGDDSDGDERKGKTAILKIVIKTDVTVEPRIFHRRQITRHSSKQNQVGS